MAFWTKSQARRKAPACSHLTGTPGSCLPSTPAVPHPPRMHFALTHLHWHHPRRPLFPRPQAAGTALGPVWVRVARTLLRRVEWPCRLSLVPLRTHLASWTSWTLDLIQHSIPLAHLQHHVCTVRWMHRWSRHRGLLAARRPLPQAPQLLTAFPDRFLSRVVPFLTLVSGLPVAPGTHGDPLAVRGSCTQRVQLELLV
jgi:hypothetical protein